MADKFTPEDPLPLLPALLDDDLLATYLQISARLVRQWRSTGDLPPTITLPGRLTRTRRADVDAWLAALPAKTESKGDRPKGRREVDPSFSSAVSRNEG